MTASVINPADSVERQNSKLVKIVDALMRRVEQAADHSGDAYAHFQRALVLEDQVRSRTRDLEATLSLLNRSNARLSQATQDAERARSDLYDAIEAVHEGFALFDAEDRLVMRNGRFSRTLPDVAEKMGPGLRFVDYVRMVASSDYLVVPEGQTRQGWLYERLANHRKRSVNFNVAIRGDRWIQVSEQHTPGGGTAILQTDITELILLERQEREKLLDAQARLIRATLDHINQGIAIFDADLRLVGWNARLRELLSPPMERLMVGTSFATLADHFDRSLVFDDAAGSGRLVAWVECREPRTPLTLQLRTRDGVHLDVFGQEMPDRGLVISFTDVTAEREANVALQAVNESLEARVQERTLALEDALADAERANASKSRFVAAASHDLLQPLSAAKLFLASLDSVRDGAERAETIRRLQSAFESVESILGALLDISRLDSGTAAVSITSVRLQKILGKLGHEFAELARQKGLDLRVVPTGAVVRSDPSYLRRIVQNLLANAVRYTASGKVLLGVRRVGRTARIEVWDTGPGIPEAERKSVFREFQRHAGSNPGDGGMGLGLTIVERACALLGHRVELVSEFGRGTGFRVSVPLAGAGQDIAVDLPPLAEGMPGQPGVHIALVIENDPAMRTALAALLERWGISPLEAGDGAAAAALLEDLGIAPDIILADYHLGSVATGLDAVEAVTARHGDIPAVLVTADRSEAVATLCRARRIALINKPFEPARLRATIAGAMSRRAGA